MGTKMCILAGDLLHDETKVGKGVLLTFASFCFFTGLRVVIAGLAQPARVRKFNHEWKWINLMVSFIHSALATLLVFSSVYLYPELLLGPVTFQNSYLQAVVSFSTGYFIWDMYDMMKNNNLIKLWEVTLHHVGVLLTFGYNLSMNRYLAMSIIALAVEANSIFLHARKLLQMSGLVSFSNRLYIMVCHVNLMTFLVFRGTVLSWAVWIIYHDNMLLMPGFLNILCTVIFLSWCTNLVLFWRLIKSDILRSLTRSRENRTYQAAN